MAKQDSVPFRFNFVDMTEEPKIQNKEVKPSDDNLK
jgi:hypothetical protein